MKSNNPTFTGIMLLILLWLTYSILTAPSAEELKKQQEQAQKEQRDQFVKDSLAKIESGTALTQLQQIEQDTLLTPAQKDSLSDLLKNQTLSKQYGPFVSAAIGSDEPVILENEKLRISFSPKGGVINKVEVKGFLQYNHATKDDPYDKEPLVLLDHPDNRFQYFIPMTGVNRESISTADLYFQPKLEGNTLRLRAYGQNENQYIEQKYTLADNYLMDYQLTLEGVNEFMPRGESIKLDWYTYLRRIEKNPHYEATMTTVYYKGSEEGFSYCDCRTTNSTTLEEPMDWVSQSQQFFNASLFTKEGTTFGDAKLSTVHLGEDAPHLKELGTELTFATKDQKSAAYEMQWYIGPNDYNELVAVGNDFERIIPFGWSIFGFISRSIIRPLFNFFAMFISNYGLIILLLTFLIRLAMFPLQYKMILNGVKMSVIKPELEAMREKHKDDASGMQAAQMKMYQEYGLNPLGGCLPMLLTMPIWIALYRFFPASIDFRQKEFLWADDLVSYDSIWDFGELPIIHTIYGDHMSLFTLLWMISMFAFLIYNSKQMDMSAAGGANMKMMKYMQFAFPVLFFFALNSWAAGLTAYMLFSNLLNIAQTFITKNILINKDKLRASMLEAKANYKEKPQTGFMARYQELLKEQQEMERRKKQGKK